VGVRVNARVFHEVLHSAIASLLGGPDDPRERDRFVGAALDGHGQRGELTVGDVRSPTFHDPQSPAFPESLRHLFGMLTELLTIGCWYGCHESLYILHS